MRTIELDGRSYQLPQTWADVKPDQLPKLIRLLYLTPENGAMYHQLLQALLGISPKAWTKLHRRHFGPHLPAELRQRNAQVMQQLLGLCRWVWEQPMSERPFESISVTLPAQGLFALSSPEVQLWLLPEAGFVTMSYGELADLYVHLSAYIGQQEAGEGELNYLVATACRPQRPAGEMSSPDWNGDRRELYNEFIVRDRVRLVDLLPFDQKLSVLLYVASTIRTVLAKYALFDPNDQSSSGAEAYTGQGFVKNSHLLAEKGIFGNLRGTQQANAHEVLLFLEEHRADQLARQEAQQTKDA